MSLPNYMYILWICMLSNIGFSQNSNVSKATEPVWVQNIQLNVKISEMEKEARGFLFLLLDDQVNVQTKESYHRKAYKILNSQGVQEMSDFSIDFDPEYQKLKIHHIKLIRDGKVIDKLDLNNLQIIQRETNLERHLYDGRLSALFNISDVRVNDIIDYSFTLDGFNPIHKGNFQNTYFLNFTDPVDKLHLSILVPKNEELFHKVFNLEAKPKIKNFGNLKRFSFNLNRPEVISYQANTPYWYIANGYVQFSQYNKWPEVAENFSGYYKVSDSSREWLKERSNEIFKGESDSITEIIRFVQDEIRYLGFENGLNSHKPSDPREVYERRFGDCKDKSLLLSELLKINGIDANPILVSTFNSETITHKLPSPNAFDHCIVQVNFEDGKTYIDPTISLQGGNLTTTYFPDYAYGLPLNSSEKELIQFPDPENEPTKIFETIKIDEVGGKAILNVTTSYYGRDADLIRKDFSENNITEIQENYTRFYSSLYPNIAPSEEIMFDDYRNIENKVIVTEKYIIENFWTRDEENEDVAIAKFYPLSLDGFLFPNENLNRKDPFYLDPGLNVEHHISVLLPDVWRLSAINEKVKNKHFEYSFELNPGNRRFDITHRYQNLRDHVKPEDYSNYISNVKQVQNHLNYFITYNSAFVEAAEKATISWVSIVLILISIAAAIYFSYKIYNNYDLPSRAPSRYTEDSIGGWLVLLAIGLCFTPLILLYRVLANPDFFNPEIWSLWTNGYLEMGILIAFEIIFNTSAFVFSILILILFFKKRTIAPKVIIIYMVANFLFLMLDTAVVISTNSDFISEMEKSEVYTQIISSLIRISIWVPYLIFSERVKDTFVVRRASKEDELETKNNDPLISLE